MARRSVRRSRGLQVDASAPGEYDVWQRPSTSSGSSGGGDQSEASNKYESEDDSDSDSRGRSVKEPRSSAHPTASDIAQRALQELDGLFEDMYDNQRVRSGSRSGSDAESSDGERQDTVAMTLEEMTIALNAAIDRHRPALSASERPHRQSRRRRSRGVKDITGDGVAASIPPEVAQPIAHFQDVLQQRINSFQTSKKQAELSPSSSAAGDRRPPWEQQWHHPDCSLPPPTPSSACSLDGSRLSVSSQSNVSSSDSERASSSTSSHNPFAATERVKMLDQQQQTSRVWTNNQSTETSSLLDALSPRLRHHAQLASTAKDELNQPFSRSLSARSERELPSEQPIETNRKGPALEDLTGSHPSGPHSAAEGRWTRSERSSSSSSRSPSLSLSSLSSSSSNSTTSKRQSRSSSRASSRKPRLSPESQAQPSCPASQRSDDRKPIETRPSKPTTRSSEAFANAFNQIATCAEEPMCSPSWELDLSNFNP